MNKRRIVTAVAGLAALGAAGLALAGEGAVAGGKPGSDQHSPPPRPPWVNPDGTEDKSKLPDTFFQSDEKGGVKTNPDGTPVTVRINKAAPGSPENR